MSWCSMCTGWWKNFPCCLCILFAFPFYLRYNLNTVQFPPPPPLSRSFLPILTNACSCVTSITTRIQNSFIKPAPPPRNFLVALYSQHSPPPLVPGNHWSVFCLYSFAFLEYHRKGIRQSVAFWVSVMLMSSHQFHFSVACCFSCK